MKKNLLFIAAIFLLIICNQANAQKHKLVKVWETDTILKVPESVLYDAANKVLYASNIDGTDPWAKDGKGSIAKIGMDGKIIAVEWVKGLNAPKGMGVHNGKLYVADLTNIVVIDTKTGSIEKTIAVDGAGGLNDVSVGSDGVIWVSDSQLKKRYTADIGFDPKNKIVYVPTFWKNSVVAYKVSEE